MPRRYVTVSRPVSGVLWQRRSAAGDHPSARPTRGSSLAGRAGHSCPLLDLAPGGGCRAARVAPDAGALLPHRFTLACDRRTGPSAVCSLLPYPTGRPVLALASTLPSGAPTFLDPVDAGPRPPGRLTVANNCSGRLRQRS